jgi:hypothetical protein
MLKQGLAKCKVLAPLLAAARNESVVAAARNGGLPELVEIVLLRSVLKIGSARRERPSKTRQLVALPVNHSGKQISPANLSSEATIMPTLDLSYPNVLKQLSGHLKTGRTESRAFLAWFLVNWSKLQTE